MTEKHIYIKQLYREWNSVELNNELNKIENIINNYRKELKNTIIQHEKEKIEKGIKDNEKLYKFIKKVKCMLYEKLK